MKPRLPEATAPRPPAPPAKPVEAKPPAATPGACDPFIDGNETSSYVGYAAAPTTGRITPCINGLNSNGKGDDIVAQEPWDAMLEAVGSLRNGDAVYLAAWAFAPELVLVDPQAGPRRTWGQPTWGRLFQAKAAEGVQVRILMSDFDETYAQDLRRDIRRAVAALDALIDALPLPRRPNLQYQVSPHPILVPHPETGKLIRVGSHHQKLMVVLRGDETIAFCGGMDIAWLRSPLHWRYDWVAGWHDLHMKIEGRLAVDLATEFVQRWNEEWNNNPDVPPRRDWGGSPQLAKSAGTADDEAERNVHRAQMQRTVSGLNPAVLLGGDRAKWLKTYRDDVWQGYVKIVDCAERFLYLEHQYFRDVRLAQQIVTRAKRASGLIVVAVVPAKLDEGINEFTEHGNWQQHKFFELLDSALGNKRFRLYTMVGRFVHSKLILADDRTLSLGSANANPRGFLLDTELNVAVADERMVSGFRWRLWGHNLGLPWPSVAAWKVGDFFAQWDAVAKANQQLLAGKSGPAWAAALPDAAGECVVPFDYRGLPGKQSSKPIDQLTDLGSWAQGSLAKASV
jgi:phosphatidylserine/phosphatidylglycerophosphate/cardiolipin synthase-like enzyme